MQFVREADPQLGPHADLFRKHVNLSTLRRGSLAQEITDALCSLFHSVPLKGQPLANTCFYKTWGGNSASTSATTGKRPHMELFSHIFAGAGCTQRRPPPDNFDSQASSFYSLHGALKGITNSLNWAQKATRTACFYVGAPSLSGSQLSAVPS